MARNGRGPQRRGEPADDLMADVRQALTDDHPIALLDLASAMLTLVDRRGANPFDRDASPHLSRAELLQSFMGVDLPETSALLAAIAVLGADDLERRRIVRVLDEREHRLPPWIGGLDEAEVYRTVEMTDVLGDGDNVMLAMRLPTGHELSAIVYIDHNVGTLVKDAFVLSEPLDEVLSLMGAEAPNSGATVTNIPDADAKVRITDAIAAAAMTFPPFETDTWPACRPLVEWMVSYLPDGGRGYERPEWSEDDQHDLADRFFRSTFAAGLDDADHHAMLGEILWFGSDYGPGDPMRWSPVAVELLLADWIPRKIVAPVDRLEKAPELLRRFIRFCHSERGIPVHLTDETLEAVDRWEPRYQATIRSPRLQGPEAILAAVGAIGPDDEWDDEADRPWDSMSAVLDIFKEVIGGPEAMAALDDVALPDEPFDWTGIPDDIHDRVSSILVLCDGCCDRLLDTEYRTAVRRVLARIARQGPDALRRGRVDTAAAAVCWAVGRANRLFSAAAGRITQKRLLAEFGNEHASVSTRAATLLDAGGFPRWRHEGILGSPDYLVSACRRRFVNLRDRDSDW